MYNTNKPFLNLSFDNIIFEQKQEYYSLSTFFIKIISNISVKYNGR